MREVVLADIKTKRKDYFKLLIGSLETERKLGPLNVCKDFWDGYWRREKN